MRDRRPTLALAVVLAGISLAGHGLAKEGTTLFDRIHRADTRSAAAAGNAQAIREQVARTDAELEDRWKQVDVALRAARPIRHEVTDALVNWLGAFRHAGRVSDSPVAAADTRRLLRGAADEALPRKLRDVGVIRRADAERDGFAELLARRASLTTELARNESLLVATKSRRKALVDDARTQGVGADLEETSTRLTDRLGEIEPALPDVDFHRTKETLARPLRGEPDHTFGASATLVRAGGWTWRAEAGTPVRAIGDGVVVFTGAVEGWGLVAVVDHGGSYRSIYAHLQSVSVDRGDSVTRAATLGAVGESGSIDGPRFYLELRDGSKPIDPQPWFVQH